MGYALPFFGGKQQKLKGDSDVASFIMLKENAEK